MSSSLALIEGTLVRKPYIQVLTHQYQCPCLSATLRNASTFCLVPISESFLSQHSSRDMLTFKTNQLVYLHSQVGTCMIK